MNPTSKRFCPANKADALEAQELRSARAPPYKLFGLNRFEFGRTNPLISTFDREEGRNTRSLDGCLSRRPITHEPITSDIRIIYEGFSIQFSTLADADRIRPLVYLSYDLRRTFAVNAEF